MWKVLQPQARRQRWLSIYWRMFALALALCALAGLAIVAFWPDAAGIFLFGLYAIPTNSMIPLPHEPGLLYFAKYYDPFWIALAGTLGTAVAAFADYELIGRALRHPRMRSARDSSLFQWAVRMFKVQPFLTTVIFTMTPLPIYVVRVLAPAAGYSIVRYIVALMVGRFPRFYVVALLGYMFPVPTWVLVVIFALMIAPVIWASVKSPSADPELDGVADQALVAEMGDLIGEVDGVSPAENESEPG